MTGKENLSFNGEINIDDETVIEKLIKEDTLNRNSILETLIKVLNEVKTNKIISIDGEWGSGKTVFVKQLQLLSKLNINNIKINDELLDSYRNNFLVYYYNAWENDFHKYPLLSLIYKILNDFPSEKIEIIKDDKTIPVFLNNIIKALSVGIIDINAETNLKNLIEDIFTVEEIKKSLNNIINNLIVENKSKMIIIIDELDRCNPNFAISMLETIKQFYNNDNLIFIVSTNNKQLCNTICKHYGEKFDSAGYLNKFYNLSIYLDNIEMDNYLENFIGYKKNSYYARKIPLYTIKQMNFAYREVNLYVSSILMIENILFSTDPFSTNAKEIFKYFFIPYSLALKVKNLYKFSEFISGNGFEEFKSFYLKTEETTVILDRIINKGIEEKKNVEEELSIIYESFFKTENLYNYERIGLNHNEIKSMVSIIKNISFI